MFASTTSASPGSPVARLRTAAGDIKLAHSVFALPFAVLGAFLARPTDSSWARFAGQLALVVLCMVAARTWAMMVNRLADRDIDAANPRTARRAVASGRLGVRDARLITLGAAAVFMVACAGFWVAFDNAWPLLLGLPVLGWIALYSYTKRFTWLCHVFLGGALAASPLAAAIAVEPSAVMHARSPAVFALAGMVVLWVAGFDVIYALQDVAFDRQRGLFSIPSRLGVGPAIWISRGLHAGAFALLVLACRMDPRLGWLFGAAVAAVAGLLVIEHVILARRSEAGLDMAFFTVNGVVSCVVGAAGVADLLA